MQVADAVVEDSRNKFKRHLIALGALAAIAVTLSLVLWFHPTAGYAKGGVLDGADLRSDLIQLLWWCFGGFAIVSTAVLAALPLRLRGFRFALAYALSAGAVVLLFPLLDRYY